MKIETREQWLNEIAKFVNRRLFKRRKIRGFQVKPLDLKTVQFNMAYSPNQRIKAHAHKGGVDVKLGHIGLCHYDYKVGNEQFGTEIFITPNLTDPIKIVGVLIHEMIHAITKGHGHKGAFRDIALDVGLEGRMTATTVGQELADEIKSWIAKVGKLPHNKWIPRNGRKQSTRMVKAVCDWDHSPYIARLSRKAIRDHGAPICPTCYEQMDLDY